MTVLIMNVARRGRTMTKEEGLVSDFIRMFHCICLEEQNFEKLGHLMAEEIEWLGAGTCGRICGRETALTLLKEEFPGKDRSYRIMKSEYYVSKSASSLYLFSGICYVCREGAGNARIDYELRVTGVCSFDEEGGIMRQLHHSLPDKDWNHTYQQTMAENTRVLRTLVGQQSRELEETNMNLAALIHNIPGGVICCEYSRDLELLFYSDRFLSMFGYTDDEIVTLFENKFSRMIVAEDLEATWDEVIRQMKISNTKEIEYRVRCKDGSFMMIQDRGQLVQREGKTVFYCILLDITERRRADEELRLSLERYQIIMNQATDILFEWDIRKDELSFSSNWKKKFGYDLISEKISNDVPLGGNLYPEDRKIFKRMQADMLNGVPYGENEIRIRKADGCYIWCGVHFTLQTDQNGRPARVVGLIADIDKEKREKERLKDMAEKDSLTGLYNRGAVQTLIQRYVVKSTMDDWCALMILDVDNFKKINDVYGHLSGDMMLKDIADRLLKLFPENAVIGRVGGDEFAVLMCHVKTRKEVEQKAEEILQSFQEIQLDEDSVSCSLGISLSPENGNDFATIYKSADSALYRAKRRGKNRYAFFEIIGSDMTALSEDRGPEIETASFGQELEGYILDLLAHAEDMESAIRQVLEIVGRQADVSRAYIFEDNEEGTETSNTFEWCNEGIEPQIDGLQKIELTDVDRYYDNFNEDGIFFCRDVRELLARDRLILEAQGIKSILQCHIMENGKIRGFIGFDECTKNRYWTRQQILVLQMLAKILGMYLLKGRAGEKLKKTMVSFQAALDNEGDWFYVLDKKSCRFLYGNQAIAEIQPEVKKGGVCYEVFFGASHMCDGCPLALIDDSRTSASGMVWNPNLKQYVYTRAQSLFWPGGKDSYMVSCRVIEDLEMPTDGHDMKQEEKG